MKFSYKKKDIEIEYEGKDRPELINAVVKLVEILEGVGQVRPTSFDKNFKETLKEIEEVEEERPIIRERIPNENEDLKMYHETNMAFASFACPSCSQRTAIKIDDNVVLKDILAQEQTLYSLERGYSPESIEEILKLTGDELASIIETEDVKLVSSSDINGYCINCQETHSTKEWLEYYNKIKNENLCPVCGGSLEYVVKTDVETSGVGYLCENNCIYNEIIQKEK